MIWICTGGRPSNGAKALAEQPGFKRCRTGKGIMLDDVVVNWGCSQNFDFPIKAKRIFNKPEFVKLATNKLSMFEYLFGSESKFMGQLVEWTDSKHEAQVWLDKEAVVVARTKLTGHSGDGIIIVEPGQELPDAPLYTKYVWKVKEFRVHVVGGKVIDTQRKIKDPDVKEPKTWKVRSHDNGFIFARNGILPDIIRDQLAIDTVQALLLDFGAVDIVQDKHGKYFVLEVNTAPGLEGQTVEHYAEAFRGATG